MISLEFLILYMWRCQKMSNIWLTSDLHLCHDRKFLYGPRGFDSVNDMNKAIVERWNAVVQPDDIVYVLGDIMLNDNDEGMRLLKSLKGHIRIVLGNHDTATRQNLYPTSPNVEDVQLAAMLKYKGYHFFMTHYPCMTGNLEKESLKQMTLNLYGHTHQQTNFYQDMPFIYHVGLDSHNCTPVHIDQIIEDMKNKVDECKAML